MFCGSTNLKKRSDGTLSNSTKSCKILELGKVGMSYKQVIFYRFLNKKNETCIVFNTTKFSQTTSCHQSELRSYLKGHLGIKKTYYVDLTSLNNFESYFSSDNLIEFFEDRLNRDDPKSENSQVFELLSDLDYQKKDIEEVKKWYETEKQDNLKSQKENRRLSRLAANIENLNYKTPQGLLKALKYYDRGQGKVKSHLRGYGFKTRLAFDFAEKIELLHRASKLKDFKKEFLNFFEQDSDLKTELEKLSKLELLSGLGS